MVDILEIKRRRLPHWTLKGSTYFVTWRLAFGVVAMNPQERQVVVDTLLFFKDKRYRLLGYVVMDDHVHVVIRPIANFTLSSLLHSWKRHTARQINMKRHRQGTFWLDERYDRLIRDENELMQKLEYVITNPMRRWPEITDYPWVGWLRMDSAAGL